MPPMVVVADSDAEIRDTVTAFMSGRGYRVEPAADAEAAAGLLDTYQVDVLISDLAMRAPGGGDLLSFARAAAPATRRIAIAANITPRDREAALRLGAIRVLDKPLSLPELADAISLANDCASGFHGWMHRISLVDVLQMYHHAGQSLVLSITGEVSGSVSFHLGELIHAACGGLSGMAALTALLTAERGQLETSALEQVTRTITGPFDHTLLDGLRSLDESRVIMLPTVGLASVDSWLDEPNAPDEPDPLDREALVRWLAVHAPGAGVWRVDPSGPSIVRLDSLTGHPEHEIAATPGSLGWAYELAELADPTWTRVELISGATAIALIRAPGVVLALARVVPNEAVERRFHLESAQLLRWLDDHTRRP